MSGLFNTIEIGRSTLMAQQTALNVLNHNIANANTPGYSRQRVNMASRGMLGYLAMDGAGGVDVAGIQRLTDPFLMGQIGRVHTAHGEQTALSSGFDMLEVLFGEPVDEVLGEKGLGDAVAEFLSSWQTVINPEMESDEADMRGLIIESARVMTQRFNSLAAGIIDLAEGLQADVRDQVDEVNRLLADVAELDHQIGSSEVGESARGDLLDARQIKLNRLAELVGAEWELDDTDHLQVRLGGRILLDHTTWHGLAAETLGETDDRTRGARLVALDDPNPLAARGGTLRGKLRMINEEIPGLIEQLDKMAATLIDKVNAIHQAASGSTGGGVDIFVGTNASTIAVSRVILDNHEMLSLNGQLPGGQDIGSAIFALHTQPIAASGGLTIEGMYSTLVGDLGARSASATQMENASGRLLESLEAKLESLTGVSVDEELTDMMVIQSTFQAASRVLAVVDELLETVLTII
ncbi:MAG: flagellar hook-associated protein FlgK [Candidatus Krumholzibacteriota bacterium]|nr:flagellar hook-associated protein FlgK [Candidatus Krumholzibacteriota bacterium]